MPADPLSPSVGGSLAAVLLRRRQPVLSEVVTRTRAAGTEHALTLAAPPGVREYEATDIIRGGDRSVRAPDPPVDDERLSSVVRIHSHPIESPVAFSIRDVRHFMQATLRTTPFGECTTPPSGYAVVGQRPADGNPDRAYLHTLEPTSRYAGLGDSARKRLLREANERASPTDPAVDAEGDPSPALETLAPYIRYGRERFLLTG